MSTIPANTCTRSSYPPLVAAPTRVSSSGRDLDATPVERKGNAVERIVSTPDPGEFSSPLSNGHTPDLLVEDLAAYEAAAIPVQPAAQLIAHQTSELQADLAALLGKEADSSPGTSTTSTETPAPLPGFETLTEADLWVCPSWCIHQDLQAHSDGFDTDPDSAPHRGVEHTIHTIHGGESIDHAGRADVTVQLEQDRDLSTGPTVNVSVVVRGIEQYAWLTLPETRALHQALGHLITETDNDH